jgi:hypothetical protein
MDKTIVDKASPFTHFFGASHQSASNMNALQRQMPPGHLDLAPRSSHALTPSFLAQQVQSGGPRIEGPTPETGIDVIFVALFTLICTIFFAHWLGVTIHLFRERHYQAFDQPYTGYQWLRRRYGPPADQAGANGRAQDR